MRVNIASKSLTELKQLKAKDLDEKWLQKYPNGMFYAISFNSGKWSTGLLTDRPTSRSYRHALGSGPYMSKSYSAVKSHHTFNSIDSFMKFIKSKEIPTPDFIINLEG